MRLLPIQMVREFHEAFDCPINLRGMPELNDRVELRFDLIQEELNEYIAAARANDPVEMLDALGDIVYVVCGAALEWGMQGRSIYLTAPAANDRYVPFTGYVDRDAIALVQLVSGLKLALHNRDLPTISGVLGRLYIEVVDLAEHLGLPLNEALVEIHRSNMAKLVDGKVVRRDDGKILKPQGWTPPDLATVLEMAA